MPSESDSPRIDGAQLLEALSRTGSIAGVLADLPGTTETDVQQALRTAAEHLRTRATTRASARKPAVQGTATPPGGGAHQAGAVFLARLPRFLCAFLGMNLLCWCIGFSWALSDWQTRRQDAGDGMFIISGLLGALLLVSLFVAWLVDHGQRQRLAGLFSTKLGRIPGWLWQARRAESAHTGALGLLDGSLHHLDVRTGTHTPIALADIRGLALLPAENLLDKLRGIAVLRFYLEDTEHADFSIPAGAACLRQLHRSLDPAPPWAAAIAHERRRAGPQLLWLGALLLAASAVWGGLVVQGWMRAQVLELDQFRLLSVGPAGGQTIVVQCQNRGGPAQVHRVVVRDRFVVDYVPPLLLIPGANTIDISAAVDAQGISVNTISYERLKSIVIETDQGHLEVTIMSRSWSRQ